jgi:hypothetical protein
VTCHLEAVPIGEAMGLVARSVGADAARIGGAWYIGELSPEDRGVLVRRVPGYPLPELRAAVLSITSTDGRASVLEGGVIVVGDRVELLERVTELLDGVEQARGGTWSVELCVVSGSAVASSSGGLEGLPELSWSLLAGAGSGAMSGELVQAAWSGLVTFAASSDRAELRALPAATVRSGRETVLSDTRVLRIPRSTVSDQGTVTVTGFERVEAGLQARVLIEELELDKARVDVSVEVSDVLGRDGLVPEIQERVCSSSLDVERAGVYLVGALDVSTTEHTNGVLSFLRGRTKRRLYVWMKVERL